MERVLQDYLPQAYVLYNRYYEPYSTYLAPLQASFLHYQSLFFRFVYPALFPFWKLTNYTIRTLLANVSNSDAASPSKDALISFLALALIFVISLKVFNFLRRQVMWWVSLVTTLGTYGLLALGGFYVYSRGLEQSVDDLAWAAGVVMGWAQEGNTQGGRLASEREWDAERLRRQNGGRTPGRGSGGRGW